MNVTGHLRNICKSIHGSLDLLARSPLFDWCYAIYELIFCYFLLYLTAIL